MKFSYNWLNSLIDNQLPKPEELAQKLNAQLFEVDQLEKFDNDWLIELDILPSRSGDCLSHIGVAREITTILGLDFKDPLKEVNFGTPGFPVEVLDSSDCPRYMAMTISEIEVGSSPDWIKERLEVCGMQSINNVVDIANYVMLETGQPLHIFDKSKVSNKIIVRRAQEGEKIITLDNKEYLLDKQILLIADEQKPLAIAGIKGGKDAEVKTETKEIIVESALFNRKVIRRGSAILKLRTDASIRFEYGFDPNLSQLVLARFASLLGGKASNDVTDIYPEKPTPKVISLNLDKVNRVLGVDLEKSRVVKILSSLGFKVGDNFEVEIPTRRVDISIQEDLIEEIGRLIGYENIEPILPKIDVSVPKVDKKIFWEEKIKDLFVAAGFTEIYSHSFVSEEKAKLSFEVECPVSREQKYLRSNLASQIVESVEHNKRFLNQFKIFELGKIFDKKEGERSSIAGAITGDSFLELKGAIDFVFQELAIKLDYEKDSTCSAKILLNGKPVGLIKSLPDFSLFEIELTSLIPIASEERVYQPIAKYPESTRDLSVIVPEQLSYKELLDKIEIESFPLLKKIELFDIYRGEGISKSFALHLTFSADRTLKAEEVNQVFNQIIEKLEKDKDLQVRR